MMNYYNPIQPNANYQDQLNQLQNQFNNRYQQINPQIQMQQMQQMQQQVGFTIIPVSSLEEVKAKSVDWSGKVDYFIDNTTNKIYSKFLDLNGVPKIYSYSLDLVEEKTIEYATKDEVAKLRSVIDNFLEGLGEVKNE